MLEIQVRKIGGGYLEAFFNTPAVDAETGEHSSIVERVLGGGDAPEAELMKRLRIRFPGRKLFLKRVN